jgi:hypothetical protein
LPASSTGADEARAEFDAEPDVYRWIFQRAGGRSLSAPRWYPDVPQVGAPGQDGPEGFYRKLGFQLIGEKSEGQTVGVLDLTNA